MKEFNALDPIITGEIKRVIFDYIDSTKHLSEEQKKLFMEELGYNWFDNRLRLTQKVIEAIEYFCVRYVEEELTPLELWSDVAKANAVISNNPQCTADYALNRYKEVIKEQVKEFIYK